MISKIEFKNQTVICTYLKKDGSTYTVTHFNPNEALLKLARAK